MATQAPPPSPQSREQWKAQRAQWKMQARMQRARSRAASRGSLLGPVLLILLGVFALLMTLHRLNFSRFWMWYGHWWPLVLIGAGVLLALESLAFSSYSRIRMGGGVVLLLLILAGLGIAAANNHVDWTALGDHLSLGDGTELGHMFGERHEATESIVHALPPGAAVVIQNPNGNVTVTSAGGMAAANEMKLVIQKTVYGNSGTDSQRKMQTLEPLITANGGVVTIHMPTNDSKTADMTLTLPANVPLELHAGHGDVTVTGRSAAVTLSADHGDVELTSITGAVHTAMRNGDFSAREIQGDLTVTGRMNDVTASQVTGAATLDGDFFGDVHFENLHGPVHLHSSRTDIQLAQLSGSVSLDGDDLMVNGASGPIAVSSGAKDVTLRHVSGDIRVHNSNGAIEVSTVAPVGALNIENREGSVQVTLPSDGKFSVEATAVDGEVHTDFNLATENGNEHSIVSGSVNGGGPLVHITAEKGDITLHKAG